MAIVLSFQVPRRRLGGKHIRAPPTVRGRPLQEWNAPPSGNVKRMRTHLHLQYRKRGEEEGERE